MKYSRGLKKLLAHFGSEYRIAKELGISKQAVNRWYKGEGNPSLTNVMKAVEVTKGSVPASDFVGL